jgi:hypothetical protein
MTGTDLTCDCILELGGSFRSNEARAVAAVQTINHAAWIREELGEGSDGKGGRKGEQAAVIVNVLPHDGSYADERIPHQVGGKAGDRLADQDQCRDSPSYCRAQYRRVVDVVDNIEVGSVGSTKAGRSIGGT